MRHASFQSKLFGCFGLILLFASAVSLHSVYNARNLRTRLQSEVDVSFNRLDQARQIETAVANMRMAMRGISLFSMDGNTALAQKARTAFEATAQEMQDITRKLLASRLSPEDAATVTAIQSGFEQWMRDFAEFADLSIAGRGSEADSIAIKKTTPVLDSLQKNTKDFVQSNQRMQATSIAALETAVDRDTSLTLVLTVLLAVAACIALLVVARATKSLRSIAHSVVSGAEQVAAASAEISNASHSLAQGSTEQAASLEETAAAAEQVSATAHRNQETSDAAAVMVGHSSKRFGATNEALRAMVVAMGEISSSSDKISRIIKVIDEIAFQTNILALNAAVEAARAGVAGAGFAVVADEVRNLAQRCAQAARDTTTLIEESISNSSGGKAKVDNVAGSIHEISEVSGKLKTLIDDVHSSSREQATGMEQIRHAVQQMEQVTQKNAASAEETASAAEELAAQSDALRNVAGTLTALVGGGGLK